MPGLSLSGGTVSLGQLQHRFPQYNGVSSFRKPDSASAYSGYTFSAQKATPKGSASLTPLLMERNTTRRIAGGYLGPTSGTYADQYNPRAEWGLGAQNVLWDNAASFVYELPIGPGRAFLNRGNVAASKFVSGWQISGIENYSAGTPVVIGGVNNGQLRPFTVAWVSVPIGLEPAQAANQIG